MATTRPFSYNPPPTPPITGTTNLGTICIGVADLDYSANPGGLTWWMGPDEDSSYVVCKDVPDGNFPTPLGPIGNVQFWRSTNTDEAFRGLVQTISGTTQASASEASDWLNDNGYWTNWVGSSFDTDAQAFIDAAGITDPTQQTAVNQLVLDLKSYGIWEKYSVIYPFVGGSSSTCSYNLKTPSSYQISFYGGWTWNSNGITSGVNSYGDTGFSPYSGFNSDTDYQYSIYSRTVGVSNDFFTLDVTGCDEYGYMAAIHNLFIRDSNQLLFYDVDGGYITRFYSSTDGSGLYTISRTNSTNYVAYRNGTAMTLTVSGSGAGSRPVSNVVITGLNDPCSGISALGTIKNYAFWAMGNGLTSIESSNLYTAVQAFQQTLGRQV